jgi:UDP-glucose 4-epimerase
MQAALGVRDEVLFFGGDYDTPDGTCIRDYIHVEDLAEAHVAALDVLEWNRSEGVDPVAQAVNVGTGVGTSVLEVIRATEAVSGTSVPYRIVERRLGDPVAIWADPTGSRDLLGWEARLDLSEIVETAYRWHRSTR